MKKKNLKYRFFIIGMLVIISVILNECFGNVHFSCNRIQWLSSYDANLDRGFFYMVRNTRTIDLFIITTLGLICFGYWKNSDTHLNRGLIKLHAGIILLLLTLYSYEKYCYRLEVINDPYYGVATEINITCNLELRDELIKIAFGIVLSSLILLLNIKNSSIK